MGQDFQQIVFFIKGEGQIKELPMNGSIAIDDIYFINGNQEPFTPPLDDDGLIAWLKGCSLRYFIWNYINIDGAGGIVSESSFNRNKVSLSGMGYAIAAFILAQQDGMLTAIQSEEAHSFYFKMVSSSKLV